ncbi:hypothetical protein ABT337_25145 [Saccharopolyspora hirsuta]|uniref:Ferredoxin n=1 Tax=Saccharopolyspora hirsuta TaxID=1837 RepID=A0A5M7BEC7_SACHI|nr:hypothetical protein [Saccharopolyspora hirsuta]KAA5825924.1 hypothetical protein F1721_32750 [Saccharopolyspora hirsuta]
MSTWAKAPDLADRPQQRAAVREGTAADRDTYLRDGLRPVRCERCAACVLAKKNSPQHTSVQWSAESVRQCAEFAAREPGEVAESCPDLQRSIAAAAHDGRLPTTDGNFNGNRRSDFH